MSLAKVIVVLTGSSLVNCQMTDELRKTITDDHNVIRRSIEVKNMPKMYYDMNLECMAKRWVTSTGPTFGGHNNELFSSYDACADLDRQSIRFGRIAENWASAFYGVAGATNAWCDLESGGCSERQSYEDKFDADMNAPPNSKDCSGGVYGHFDNIAHQDYVRVGCWYTSRFGTLCNYGGAFNVATSLQPIQGANGINYGEKCALCPGGTECRNDLCVTLALETDDDTSEEPEQPEQPEESSNGDNGNQGEVGNPTEEDRENADGENAGTTTSPLVITLLLSGFSALFF
eukprot:Awhi_evm1s15088